MKVSTLRLCVAKNHAGNIFGAITHCAELLKCDVQLQLQWFANLWSKMSKYFSCNTIIRYSRVTVNKTENLGLYLCLGFSLSTPDAIWERCLKEVQEWNTYKKPYHLLQLDKSHKKSFFASYYRLFNEVMGHDKSIATPLKVERKRFHYERAYLTCLINNN